MQRPNPAHPGLLLAGVALPLAVLSVDFAGVSVALPDIAADLGATSSDVGWIVSAFALGAAAPVLLVGRRVDRIGRRRVMLAGVTAFLAATVVCGLAPTLWVLILGRLAQGVGTALFMPASLSVLAASFRGGNRTRAIGIWGAVGGLAGAAAPLVGGLVVGLAGWRWFFLVNVPLLVGALVIVPRTVPESTGESGPVATSSAVLGVLWPTATVLAFQLGGSLGWTSPAALTTVTVAVVSALAWGLRERSTTAPLVERAVRAARAFRAPVAVAFLANWGFGAITFLLTFWLQSVMGRSALATGLAFLAYSLPFATLGAVNSRVIHRFGSRRPMGVGCGLVALSFLTLTLLDTGTSAPVVATTLVLSGIGQGLAYNVSTSAAMGSTPVTSAGSASGVLTTVRNIGVAAGISVALTATTATGAEPTASGGSAAAITAAAWVIAAVSALGALVAVAAWPAADHRPRPDPVS